MKHRTANRTAQQGTIETTTITFRLPAEIRERLEAEAFSNDVTVSQLIRKFIREDLNLDVLGRPAGRAS